MKQILKAQLIISLLAIILGIFLYPENAIEVMGKPTIHITLVSFLLLFSYYAVLKYFNNIPEKKLNNRLLIKTVFIYSLIFVTFFNIIFYAWGSINFFEFNAADSMVYYSFGIDLSSLSIDKWYNFLVQNLQSEDWSMVIYISLLFKIISTELFLNFINILLSLYVAKFLFRISLNYMSRKHAFLAALSYGISSYFVYFHATGLKESCFVFCTVSFIYCYINYTKSSKIGLNILGMAIFAFIILGFRPVVVAFLLMAIGVSFLPAVYKKPIYFVGLLMLIVIAFFMASGFASDSDKYTVLAGQSRGSTRAMSSVSMNSNLVLVTNILVAICGPFPTFFFDGITTTYYYSVGLIFKVLISYFFYYGVYIAYKNKNVGLYAIAAFVLIESATLLYINRALELRLMMPQTPFVYIIAFYGLDQATQSSSRKRIFRNFSIYSTISLVMILIWMAR